MALHIPSPPVNGFHIGAAFIHFYGLMYVIGIALAVIITRRRWEARGGNPALVADVATWAVPAGIIGARIYFDLTTPADIPHHWWGVFAVWSGGLGVWGGIAAGALAGAWRVRRAGASVPLFMDAIAPALLVAQAVGRLGNYFNQELFGKPTSLPWGLQIDPQFRPQGYTGFTTFQPTFLYELLFDLALAGLLVWLGRRGTVRPPGLFALYVTGYSAFRIFEESLRIDSSVHFLGLRLNFFIAALLTLAGAAWFVLSQRGRPDQAGPADRAEPEPASPEVASSEVASSELASSEHSGADKAVSGDQGGQAGLGQTV
jgi:prolipoprotein diacylglyceryl transferase